MSKHELNWEQHADAVANHLSEKFPDRPVILPPQSGAGPVLTAIRQATIHPIAAYVFVGLVIPQDGKGQLNLMQLKSPQSFVIAPDFVFRCLSRAGKAVERPYALAD